MKWNLHVLVEIHTQEKGCQYQFNNDLVWAWCVMFEQKHIHMLVCVRAVGEDQRIRLSHVWGVWEMASIKCSWDNLIWTKYNSFKQYMNGEAFQGEEKSLFSLHFIQWGQRAREGKCWGDFERERESKVWGGEKAWRGTQESKRVVVGWMEVLMLCWLYVVWFGENDQLGLKLGLNA